VDKAFGWIGEIFQSLLKLIPWLVIVPATHGGVAFVRGHRIKEWKPGLHWYWPVVTTHKLMTTVRQTQMIQSKVVMTKDLRTVIVGALVTYIVDDVVAAISRIADLPSDVIERSQGAILAEVGEFNFEQIQSDRAGFNANLHDKVSKMLNGYGVHVLQVQITEFAPCRAFVIKSQGTVGQYQLWTGF
jgi:regulator of protease activity HflC (stomatin/prohibitin superfamily)